MSRSEQKLIPEPQTLGQEQQCLCYGQEGVNRWADSLPYLPSQAHMLICTHVCVCTHTRTHMPLAWVSILSCLWPQCPDSYSMIPPI